MEDERARGWRAGDENIPKVAVSFKCYVRSKIPFQAHPVAATGKPELALVVLSSCTDASVSLTISCVSRTALAEMFASSIYGGIIRV